MIRTTTSSSSTLSPLAPPFTVDTYRYRYPPPPPTTPELNVNESFSGGEALPVGSVDKNSSWIDPSGFYNASPLSAGCVENFMAYGDGYGTWHGNHSDSTAFQAEIGDDPSSFQANAESGSSAFRAKTEADSSAWQDNQKIYNEKKTDPINSEYSYFQLPDPNLVVQECPTSNSKSSYDRYISQLVTSSSDSFACCPPKKCLSSAHICPPDNITGTSTYYVQKNAYQSTEHGTLFYDVDDNYLDYMLRNKIEPASNQYMDYKGDYVKGYVASGKNKGTNWTENSSVAAVCSSSGDEITTDARHNFAVKQMNSAESVSPSVTSSAEYFDQPNQTEDSPCWKGASNFRECPFNGVDDVNHYDEVKELENSVGLIQGQKCVAVGAQCMKTLLEVSFSGIDKTEGSRCAEVASVILDKSTERTDLMRGSEAEDILMMQPINGRTATMSTNDPILPESSQNKLFNLNLGADNNVRNFSFSGAILDEVSNPIDTTVPSAECAKGRKDVIHLVKAMHNISEALLLSSLDSEVNWEESDHELIKLVIANLESFASRNKKETTRRTSAENSFNIWRSHGSSQKVSVEDLESDVFNKKESNPQVLVYKNLWMQAEAALCSLKYELQLTRLKVEMENLNCEKKVMNPVQAMKSPMQNPPKLFDMLKHTTPPLACNDAPLVQNDAVSNSETKPKERKSNMEEAVESSMMARLEILRGRYAQSTNNNNSEHTKHLATETMFNDFADLGFVESRVPHQLDGDGNKDVNMASGSFLQKFSNELDVYLTLNPNLFLLPLFLVPIRGLYSPFTKSEEIKVH